MFEATDHEVNHFVLIRLFADVVADCRERLTDDRDEHSQQDEEYNHHVQQKHERSKPTSLQQILYKIVCILLHTTNVHIILLITLSLQHEFALYSTL